MSGFFQRLFISTGLDFANIELDAKIEESFEVSTTITDHPVDSGTVVSDNAYTNPEIYTLTGAVSDTPLSLAAAVQQAGDNILNLVNNGSLGVSGSFLNDSAPRI